MTLSPGDVILTGTPEGVVDVDIGDDVVVRDRRIGSSVNTIVGRRRLRPLTSRTMT